MQISKIAFIKQNFKSSYKSTYGTFFVHQVELEDGGTFEWHSKSENLTKKVGDEVAYSVTQDKQGNNKIKFEKMPERSETSQPPKVGEPPYQPQKPTIDLTKMNQTHIWLSVFNSLAVFKAGDPKTDSKALIEATNSIVKQVPQ